MSKPPFKKTATDDRQRRWKFGQNFLIDDSVIRGICEDVPATTSDWIIEIGPGSGALTKQLAPRCQKLTAIEIDPRWTEKLRGQKNWGNLDVVEADAMRLDWESLLAQHAPEPGKKPMVVGNLPYNRAAPILFCLLPHLHLCHSAQIMVQYEVAKRICSKPHSRDFSFLSVAVQNLALPEFLRKITPEAFRPRPNVWSATVRLLPRSEPVCADPFFKVFVDRAFSQRRKQMANSLQPAYQKTATTAALTALGLRPDSRAEDLSVEEFAGIFKILGPERPVA